MDWRRKPIVPSPIRIDRTPTKANLTEQVPRYYYDLLLDSSRVRVGRVATDVHQKRIALNRKVLRYIPFRSLRRFYSEF